jgi:peptide/nickel transport system permease protein
VPLAILLGLVAVRYRERWPDKLISGGPRWPRSQMPEFLIGYL